MLLPPALTVTLVMGAVPILLTLFLLFLRATSEASTASAPPARRRAAGGQVAVDRGPGPARGRL